MSAPEIAALVKATSVELEAFVFGGLCVMAEGRCALSSYATGRSPNLSGVCSPPEAVSFETDTNGLTPRLAGVAIDRFRADEAAGYPTLCKGRFAAMGETSYLFEDPVSLNAMTVLRDLRAAGVTAIKVEGRQRGKTYVRRVTEAFRGAIDALDAGRDCESFARMLTDLAEGGRETEGAYKRKWR
jgi:putative protease